MNLKSCQTYITTETKANRRGKKNQKKKKWALHPLEATPTAYPPTQSETKVTINN